MSAASVLARGRARAESLMCDACTIQHPTGFSAPNGVNGVLTPTYTPVYTGVCKVQGAASASGQNIAEAHVAVLSPIVHLPITVTGVVEGDVVTITAAAYDPELVGRVFRVMGPAHKSYATARRLVCSEVTS